MIAKGNADSEVKGGIYLLGNILSQDTGEYGYPIIDVLHEICRTGSKEQFEDAVRALFLGLIGYLEKGEQSAYYDQFVSAIYNTIMDIASKSNGLPSYLLIVRVFMFFMDNHINLIVQIIKTNAEIQNFSVVPKFANLVYKILRSNRDYKPDGEHVIEKYKSTWSQYISDPKLSDTQKKAIKTLIDSLA